MIFAPRGAELYKSARTGILRGFYLILESRGGGGCQRKIHRRSLSDDYLPHRDNGDIILSGMNVLKCLNTQVDTSVFCL